MCRYELIVDTAFNGARAIAAGHTENGDPIARTMSNTFMRCEPLHNNTFTVVHDDERSCGFHRCCCCCCYYFDDEPTKPLTFIHQVSTSRADTMCESLLAAVCATEAIEATEAHAQPRRTWKHSGFLIVRARTDSNKRSTTLDLWQRNSTVDADGNYS